MRCRQHAFTMIELLIVVAIIVTLTSVLTVFVSMARKTGGMLATRSIMNRIDTALGAFKLDTGTYPYQDHDGLPNDQPAVNNLAKRLGHDLNTVEWIALRDDLNMVAAKYAAAPDRATSSDVPAAETNAAIRPLHAGLVNRMAVERGRMAVLAGNQGLLAIVPRAVTAQVYSSLTGPGWCADYFEGGLSAREFSGEAILDGFRKPIIYLNPVITGVTGISPPGPVTGDINKVASIPIDPMWWRLDTRSNRSATVANPDMRISASPSYLLAYELWGAGADGRFSFLRPELVNRDNIAFHDYSRGVP
jgi:prepilin-type N-terminal cleavage/methylation domain-containing protein